MSDGKVGISQAISWVISAAVFFAGITFGIIGRADSGKIGETASAVRLQEERIRKLETVVEVQQVQYLNIMAAISELKVEIKEHTRGTRQ